MGVGVGLCISKMTRARATSVPRMLSLVVTTVVALVGLVLNLILLVKSSPASI
jgi:hypothetical protein